MDIGAANGFYCQQDAGRSLFDLEDNPDFVGSEKESEATVCEGCTGGCMITAVRTDSRAGRWSCAPEVIFASGTVHEGNIHGGRGNGPPQEGVVQRDRFRCFGEGNSSRNEAAEK